VFTQTLGKIAHVPQKNYIMDKMKDYKILTDLESKFYEIIVYLTNNLFDSSINFENKTKPIYTLSNVGQQDYLRVTYKEKEDTNSFIDTIVVKTVNKNIYDFIVSEIKAARYRQIDKMMLLLDKGMFGRLIELQVPMHKKPKFDRFSSNVTYSEPTNKHAIFLYEDDLESDAERHKTIEVHMNRYVRPNQIY